MRVSPESIILSKNFQTDKRCFLILGNEEGLIRIIKNNIIDSLKQYGFGDIVLQENVKIDENFVVDSQGSLFNSKKIYIFKNASFRDIESLKNIDFSESAVIFESPKMKSSDKVKKKFDIDLNYVSISCYTLSKESKTKIFNNFLKDNLIKLSTDSYWFFLDKTDNSYYLFEKEMEKLIQYKNREAPLKEIKLLLSGKIEDEVSSLFFLINKSAEEIVIESKKIINTSGDSAILLQKIKFYIDIFKLNILNHEKNLSLPSYMFKEKDLLQAIYKKINIKKIVLIFKLIKKSELIQRKYPSLHQLISQRFLLNLKKIIQ